MARAKSAPEPRRLITPLAGRGGEAAVLEFGDPARPVDLVFVHANGFNARTYTRLLAPLAAEGRRIWAPDLRGHGHSRLPRPPGPMRDWSVYRDDLLALLQTLEGPAPVVAGHSMGAASALLAAGKAPQSVSRLVLLDPVLWSRRHSLVMRLPLLGRLAERAPIVRATLRRRARFADRELALAAYRGRGAFVGWPDAAIRDYLEDGLVETGEGDLALACDPAWEAANYGAQASDSWGAMARFRAPIALVKAETGSMTGISTPPHAHITIETVAGGGHMFPLQKPEATRAILKRALGG